MHTVRDPPGIVYSTGREQGLTGVPDDVGLCGRLGILGKPSGSLRKSNIDGHSIEKLNAERNASTHSPRMNISPRYENHGVHCR